jgi:nucleoside-diphosphate-sugar epimerase
VSSRQAAHIASQLCQDDDALVAGGSGWIDVRDVALSVVLALETPAAGGERIIVCAGEYVWQDFCE